MTEHRTPLSTLSIFGCICPWLFLTPGEVAALFRVDPKTVTRWASSGRITSIKTPGGHRRFREREIMAMLNGDQPQAQTS